MFYSTAARWFWRIAIRPTGRVFYSRTWPFVYVFLNLFTFVDNLEMKSNLDVACILLDWLNDWINLQPATAISFPLHNRFLFWISIDIIGFHFEIFVSFKPLTGVRKNETKQSRKWSHRKLFLTVLACDLYIYFVVLVV